MNLIPNTNVIIRAKRFARDAHAGMYVDTISGDKKPQLEHLQEVADLVWASGGTDDEVAAAWLHDSVEDTSVTIHDIKEQFGEIISMIVEDLSDTDEIKDLPILERKRKQSEHITTKSNSAKIIKIADQTSNIRLMYLDPIVTWSVDDIRDYVIGAKMIVDGCKGVNPLLEELFEKEFLKKKGIN